MGADRTAAVHPVNGLSAVRPKRHSSLRPLCVGRDASVLFVAMSGLAQTIGFLGKFVKLNIRNYHFVQNLPS
ncbi:hypothetical protein E0H38_03445 [Rhizobium leguminosarum bv. viciae]|nr:hypothetical protein E0H38_03445 [Rhizobium leguminosarum bv. viciae]